VAQSPPGCVVPVPGVDRPCLFDFNVMQEYIIPRKAFCNRYITVNDPDGKYMILGFPVAIQNPRYERNEFIFNFGLVIGCGGGPGHSGGGGGSGSAGDGVDSVDQVPYERVVRRLASTFAEMEKQNGYLSLQDQHQQQQQQQPDRDGNGDDGGFGLGIEGPIGSYRRRPIESLLEIIKEDLNNYGECMIPVDDANTINMKLFPHHPAPPEVKGWHVPVPKMKFADIVDPTWDLTLQRVIAHIDGVSDVRRIAFAADVSLELCQLALRHLLYYDTILLLDIFFFFACYAPRPGIHSFIANVGGMVDECANYVCVVGAAGGDAQPPPPSDSNSNGRNNAKNNGSGSNSNANNRSRSNIAPGSTPEGSSAAGQNPGNGGGQGGHRVSNYMLIKLMTTFCEGKTVAEWLKGHMDAGVDVLRFVDVRRLVQFGVIKGCLYRVHKYVVSKQYLAALATGQARPLAGGDPLQKYTDGCHTFDQIIVEQNMTDTEIMDKLKSFPVPAGDLTVIYK